MTKEGAPTCAQLRDRLPRAKLACRNGAACRPASLQPSALQTTRKRRVWICGGGARAVFFPFALFFEAALATVSTAVSLAAPPADERFTQSGSG